MDLEHSNWRLLKTSPASGAWNMAVDEAIIEAAVRGDVPPTLRLYAWQPPCLSLGYAQPFSDVDEDRLAERGWEVVRRPTGGRAILHTDELTYSVIGPNHEPRLAGEILSSYRRLSEAILAALESLSVPVAAQPRDKKSDPPPTDPVCFEVPSTYEITVGGKKLVGSAQARRKGGVLQHGTLPLSGDLARITEALVYPDEAGRTQAAERLLASAATLESALGNQVTWEQAARAFEDAFAAVLNLDFQPGDLTPQESARASQLQSEKYAHPDWTLSK